MQVFDLIESFQTRMLSCRQIGKLISEGKKEELEKGGSAGKPYPALIRQFGD